nr:tetratricopeptide repeat protein [Pseudomonadota bacterium]
HYNLGNTLMDAGRLNEAEACFRCALEIKPDYVEAYSNLGHLLNALGHLNESETSFRCALEINPDYAEAHNNLGITLKGMGRLNESEACCLQALKINPDYVEAYSNLGITLKDLGRLNEAEASYRRALEIMPDSSISRSNLLFTLNYASCHPPLYLLEEARAWETSCISETKRGDARARQFSRPSLTGRRLRVGYVSADFRQHAVSYFVEQVFAHHDADRVEVFAYSASATRDAVTERIEVLVEHWVPAFGLSDQKLHDRIEADQIDVLIDLSGHTAQNRLGVFALRAAPVQAHWLGYFATTGLTEMDYWIGDPILTTPETDSHFTETVWRLPRTWVCYEGKAEAPESCWQPTADGTLWLGSFNNLAKLTPATFAIWAKVLHALPEAKLLLKTKGLAEELNRQRIMDTMASHGIGHERVELQDSRITADWASHMAYYNRLDIALDPVGGVGGGTTTCDALWMGVPVVSMAGDRMASRMTASMLDAIGRPEWLAESEEEYVAKVTELAHDVAGRETMRTSQRERMASSPLCDAKDLARKLEDAYFGMFSRWEEKKKQIVDLKNVVFIGDSITRGTCFSDIEVYTSFASRAAKELPVACPQYIWNVYNEGVDGSCTRDWINWIDNKVIVHNPTDVVMCLGVNDSADDSFPYHVAPDEFHGNLLFIINKIRTCPEILRVDRQAVNIILINIPFINCSKLTWGRTDPYREQYRNIIQVVAKENNCKVVDAFSEVEIYQHNFDTYYFGGDGIHISDLSHTLIYNKLLPLLATPIECVL